MKIFMVHQNPWNAGNPYISSLIEEIQHQHPDITISWGRNQFWDETIFSYDIVHFHWPHTFMPNDRHSEEDLRQHLYNIHKHGATIVATCHDLKPHYNQYSEYADSLHIVYSLCDIIIHLGETSRKLLANTYPNAEHYVIPHHIYDTIYTSFPSREESILRLKLPKNRTNILCFGTFRSDSERKLVLSVCRQLKRKKITILAPGFMDTAIPNNRFKSIIQKTKKKYYRLRYHIYCTGKTFAPIPDSLVPFFYGAADIAFIQRLDILNSGNIYMPVLFKKMVVGPDVGNVGPILKEWGCPVFSPRTPQSAGVALKKGLAMAKTGYGEHLNSLLANRLSTQRIASEIYNIYCQSL